MDKEGVEASGVWSENDVRLLFKEIEKSPTDLDCYSTLYILVRKKAGENEPPGAIVTKPENSWLVYLERAFATIRNHCDKSLDLCELYREVMGRKPPLPECTDNTL